MAHEDPEEPSLTARLLRRGGHGLHRLRMPDGGEVFGGPMAQHALDALGARAMTMDGAIFVGNQFDTSKPEDLALYAHEGHHRDTSGGHNPHAAARDDEEVASRAIERMVLHRARAGEAGQDILGDAKAGRTGPVVAGRGPRPSTEGATDPASGDQDDAMAAYRALRAQGKPHPMIVHELADLVLRAVMESGQDDLARRPG